VFPFHGSRWSFCVVTRLRSLTVDRRGTIAILAAVGMTALVGMSGFAIDLGLAYVQRAKLQKVADSAALAGAISWVKTGSGAAAQATTTDVVLANGLAASTIQTTTAPTTALPNVTVSLVAPSTLTLARVLTSYTTVTTHGYSVASIVSSTTRACLVSLTTLMVNGTINSGNCAAAANSTSSSAITVNGGGSLTASSIDTPGGIVANGSVSGTEKTGSKAATDPYSGTQSLEASAVSACKTYINYTNQTTPGCYTNANIGSAVTLTAGTYVFANLNVNSGGSITGTGVTLIAEQSFSPNGNISITAPTTGSWAGIAIYAANGVNMNSNVTYAINGALYSPTAAINLDSGTLNSSACTYIVGYSITSNSGANFTIPQTNCSSGYTAPSVAGGSKIALTQ
jgi:Flp pilus assembly protein TadG